MDAATISQRIIEAAREIAAATRGGTTNLEQVECGLAALDALVAELTAPAASEAEAGETESDDESEDEPTSKPAHRAPVRRRR